MNKTFNYWIDLKNKIEISIIVFAYNHINYTINTLESLLKNTISNAKYNFNFNLYDDCSTDNTGHYVKNNFKKINYLKQNQNRGFNYLCNLAYENNRNSNYLVLLNNDLIFSKNWLNILLDQMIENNAKAAGPITNAPGHQPQQDVRKYISSYLISHEDKEINKIANKLKNHKNIFSSFINGFCMVFNTKWLNEQIQPVFKYEDLNFGLEKKFFKNNPCKPLIVPSSFIFHCKQVTVKRNDWAKHHFRLFDNSIKYKIAVGVVTYKRPSLLNKCIASLLKQKVNIPFDIIIVDNDINMSGRKIIKTNTPKHIRIIYDVEQNKGIPFERNKIVELINNKYDKLKVLGTGEVKEKLDIEVNFISKSAKQKIEKLGGKIILIK